MSSSNRLFAAAGAWAMLCACATPGPKIPYQSSTLREVPFTAVQIDDSFWRPRIDTVRQRTVPGLLDLGRDKIRNFAVVAGEDHARLLLANAADSDIHKLVEAASYSLATRRDAKLETRLDEIIRLMAAAQDTSGYLNTQFMLPFGHPSAPDPDDPHVRRFGYGPEMQWKSTVADWPRGYSQLYVAGHLFEAAVAHYRATGKRNYLDVALRMADNLDATFDQNRPFDYADHPQVEIGLMKLYEVTGEDRYRKLADFITRNSKFHRPPDISDENQLPLTEQRNAFGHCVRTMYLYSGATDLVRARGDADLREALGSLWASVTGRKMYVHGGIGNGAAAEQHGLDYDLPNAAAYAECCASISMGQWNHRLNLLYGDAKYADLVELEAYNSALSGISLDGEKYFYRNVLASGGNHQSRWRYLFCCPSKLPGFVAGIGRWMYATGRDGVYVNLYAAGSATAAVAGTSVALRQETGYPWDGRVLLSVEPARPAGFAVSLRIPGWVRGEPAPAGLYRFGAAKPAGFSLKVNGRAVENPTIDRGYLRLARRWRPGDSVELNLEMPVRRVYARPEVRADRGRVAIMRGPIIYCLEEADNGDNTLEVALPPDAELVPDRREDLLDGVTVLLGQARRRGRDWVDVTMVPYYAWDNRAHGAMLIWLPEQWSAEVAEEHRRLRTAPVKRHNTNG